MKEASHREHYDRLKGLLAQRERIKQYRRSYRKGVPDISLLLVRERTILGPDGEVPPNTLKNLGHKIGRQRKLVRASEREVMHDGNTSTGHGRGGSPDRPAVQPDTRSREPSEAGR